MFDKIKNRIRENRNLYYWARLLKNCRNEEFKDFVRGYAGPDIVQVRHPGGLYPDDFVYCISSARLNGGGFFCLLNNMLLSLSYADFYRLTPVVSWQEGCLYREKKPFNGTDNAFEYYFEPLSEISCQDVSKCSNLVSFAGQNKMNVVIEDYYTGKREILEQCGKLYSKYCRLNFETKTYIDLNVKQVLDGKRTLGVHIRGTDFKQGFNLHPVFIGPKDFINPAKKLLKKYGYERLFLATDSLEALKLFQQEFGSMLVFYPDVQRSDGNIGVHCLESGRENHHYKLGLEVLRDACTLASCDSLLAGVSNVSFAVRYMKIANGAEYEEVKILNHGMNHNKNDYVKK